MNAIIFSRTDRMWISNRLYERYHDNETCHTHWKEYVRPGVVRKIESIGELERLETAYSTSSFTE